MASLNRAMIIGNLTRDPETRTTPQGITVTNFGVATNFTWKDQSGQKQSTPEYHNIVAWRKLGELCAQYLRKGRRVYIEGRIQTRSWDDPQGIKKQRTEIIAENVVFLDRPDTLSAQEPVTASPTQEKEVDEEEVRIEDIPF